MRLRGFNDISPWTATVWIRYRWWCYVLSNVSYLFFLKQRATKSYGQMVSKRLRQERIWTKGNSINVKLHVATTWSELPFRPLVYIRFGSLEY